MPSPRSTTFPRRRRAGSVVLLVLVTVLLAAFMITKFVQRAGTELLADARAGDQARLRRSAYSALEVTLAVLADFRAIDTGLYGPAQGWDRPLDYAGWQPEEGQSAQVEFEDESGRISLPRADAATLESLFEQTGADRNQAERAADALLVWMHPEYVPPTLEADPGNYERSILPHRAAGRPLRSFSELASVAIVRDLLFDKDGRPNSHLAEFASAVSLQSFTRVNLNGASPLAVIASGLLPAQATALQSYLHPGGRAPAQPYFKTLQDVGALTGAAAPADRFGVEVQVLRINITVRAGALRYRLSAVVAPPGDATVPARRAPATTGTKPNPDTEKATVTLKKLDYPFKVLDLGEDVESGPVPSVNPAQS